MMPSFDLAQAAIFDTSIPASPTPVDEMFDLTPDDLAEQLNIMEELGKSNIESPINIMKNDSNTVLATEKPGKNKNKHHQDTQKSLGFRKPDGPI